MSVLITNTSLGVRRRAAPVFDEGGFPRPGAAGSLVGPWPALARELADGSWSLSLDPAAAPLVEKDLVVEPATGREWLVTTAQLLQNPAAGEVDYIRVTAQERHPDGTEPGGGIGPIGV